MRWNREFIKRITEKKKVANIEKDTLGRYINLGTFFTIET